jgi:plasmid stabilization system protein ParE
MLSVRAVYVLGSLQLVIGMYVVVVLEEAHEDLRSIVAYIAIENPRAAETLGRELLDEAMSL